MNRNDWYVGAFFAAVAPVSLVLLVVGILA